MITATRYHDFSCGHRVVGHESKCAMLHGHNYRVHFTVGADSLDKVGRILDFSAIKSKLCVWLEEHWDHRFLAWEADPLIQSLAAGSTRGSAIEKLLESVVVVPFNPTAENIADFLLRVVGPMQLDGTGVILLRVTVEETRKCSATSALGARYG